MKDKIRKIFSDSLVYGAGFVLNRLLAFLLLPLYTHYFDPSAFGVFSLVYSFWFFASVFYLFGMETSFQKFFVEAKDDEGRKKIFSSALISVLMISVVLSAVLFLISGTAAKILTGNAGNSYLIKLLAVLLVVDVMSRFPMILLNSLQRSGIYSVINLVVVSINIAANIVFIVFLGMGIESILYAFIISYSAWFIISFSFCREYFGFLIDLLTLKELAKFAHSFLYYSLFLISLDLIDRFIIGYFKGESEVGIYSACYRVGMVMNLLILGFRVAWVPFFLKLKDEKENKEIFSRVFSYFFFAGMVMFLSLSLFAGDIVRISIGGISILDEKYRTGLAIVPYILLAYLFFGLYSNLNIASYFRNKIKYLVISAFAGSASNIILNLILVPEYSIAGAAIATLISYALMFAVLYFFSQKLYFIQYEWGKIFLAAFITFLLYFGNLYLKEMIPSVEQESIAGYLVRSASVAVLCLSVFLINSKNNKTIKAVQEKQF